MGEALDLLHSLYFVIEILKVGASDLADFFELLSDVVVFEGRETFAEIWGQVFSEYVVVVVCGGGYFGVGVE